MIPNPPLATTHPELAAQSHGWDPTIVSAGSNKKLEWQCDLGHIWTALVCNRSLHGNGCPYCANQSVLAGFNDLATTHPELAVRAHGWDPTTVIAGSGQRREWQCDLGHIWAASINKITTGRGCPFCANKSVLAGFNDLATTHPELAAQAHGWDPTTVIAGSQKKYKWQCDLGHVWVTSPNGRAGKGCPFCSARSVLAGFNDLATTNPELAAQAHGWDPTTVSAGQATKLDWLCADGHLWKSAVYSRKHAEIGCPTCARTGFDPNKPGWLYLIANDSLGLLQIGISNVPELRLRQHRRGGWEPIDIVGPLDGQSARDFERLVLDHLDALEIPRGDETWGKFSGHTETWIATDFRVGSIAEIRSAIFESD